MSKDYRKEIKELAKYLAEQAKKSRTKAQNTESNYCKGLEAGYANAYELCCEWLHEILE